MLEIQFHPADIRKQVRYVFLPREKLFLFGTAALLVLAVLVAGLALSPRALAWARLCFEQARAERENRSEHAALRAHIGTIGELERRIESCRLAYARFSLFLGVPQTDTDSGGAENGTPDYSGEAALARCDRLASEAGLLLSGVEDLLRVASNEGEMLRLVPSVSPLPPGTFVLSSPFGQRRSPFTGEAEFHTGIDLAAPEQTRVMATGDATVAFAGRVASAVSVRLWRLGNIVVLLHGDRYISVYGHLRDVVVTGGQRVRRGEVVGTVGNSGWSTSPHLHYEVRARENAQEQPRPVDPRIFVLNCNWSEVGSRLVADRWAPQQAFDPLPTVRPTR